MSLLTVDVGGANETVLRLVQSANLERRQIGKKRYAFAGNERSMIRAEKIVWSGALLAVSASDAVTIRSLFALGAAVACEGDVFNNGNATIVCLGEITDEMEVGGPYWNLALTLREVDGAATDVVAVTAAPPVLINWYDTQGTNFAALGIGNSDPLDPWPDESGNGFDAPAGDSSFPHTLATGVLNGHDGVYFTSLSGNGRGYDLPNVFGPTEAEAFIVMRANPSPPGSATSGGRFWDIGSEIVTGPSVPATTGGPFRDMFGSTTNYGFPLSVDPTDPFVYHVRVKNGQRRAWINGTLVYSSAINTVSWHTVGHIGIWLQGGFNTHHFEGWIGEVKLYTGWLDPSDAAAEDAALLTKWSIP
jgi:hypothetical protein